MPDPLELNLTGRVMMTVCRYGVSDPASVRVFVRAVLAVIHYKYPGERPSLVTLEPLLVEQLGMLDCALSARKGKVSRDNGPFPDEPRVPSEELTEVQEVVEPVVERQPVETPVLEEVDPPKPKRKRKKPLNSGIGAMPAKSMEDKLKDERKPVQKLLTEDCVRIGLVDKKQAGRMIKSMLGQRPEDAELAIVEELRQTLQEQVKKAIRKHKGGPWPSPRDQEAMRKDIHHTRSVKSILMLSRQIVKELRAWEAENGKGGVLAGLFGGRRGLG